MKKIVALLLVTLLLLLVIGCAAKAKTTSVAPVKKVSEKTADKKPADAGLVEEKKKEKADATKESLKSAQVVPAESKERKEKLKALVQEYITKEKYKFIYNEEFEAFIGNFTMPNSWKECTVYIYIYEDMIAVRSGPKDWLVPEKYLDKVAIFTTLFNCDSSYAYLLLDYRDGYLSSRSALVVEKALPTVEEVSTIVNMTLYALEDTGEAVLSLVNKDTDPHKEYEKVLELQKELQEQ